MCVCMCTSIFLYVYMYVCICLLSISLKVIFFPKCSSAIIEPNVYSHYINSIFSYSLQH